MTPMEHLNAFCVLFAELKSICDSGAQRKYSQEAKDKITLMYKHYPFLDDKMVKYLEQYTNALISMGFNFDEMNKASKIDVSDLDSSDLVKIKGSIEFAKIVNINEKGAIFNYNEHSKPYNKLSPEDFEILKRRTIENIRREEHMMATGQRPKAARQPKTWGLPDNERDW